MVCQLTIVTLSYLEVLIIVWCSYYPFSDLLAFPSLPLSCYVLIFFYCLLLLLLLLHDHFFLLLENTLYSRYFIA